MWFRALNEHTRVLLARAAVLVVPWGCRIRKGCFGIGVQGVRLCCLSDRTCNKLHVTVLRNTVQGLRIGNWRSGLRIGRVWVGIKGSTSWSYCSGLNYFDAIGATEGMRAT